MENVLQQNILELQNFLFICVINYGCLGFIGNTGFFGWVVVFVLSK